MAPSIYLASASPRRGALLDQLGVRYLRVAAVVDETPVPGETPGQYVLRLARAKAEAGRRGTGQGPALPVLAADTAVVQGTDILGKPRDRRDFLSMMRRLSGRTHEVLTGVVLWSTAPESRLSASRVSFRGIPEGEALAYWRSGEPRDKAGGYGIQGLGAIFVSRLEGSFSGVVGLPLFETAELLAHAGIGPLPPEPGGDRSTR